MSRGYRMNRGEVDDLGIGFGNVMDDGDTLEAPISVTVHEANDGPEMETGFTVSQEQVSVTVFDDSRNREHPIGQAIAFRLAVAGDAPKGNYELRGEAVTAAGQEKVGVVPLKVTGPEEP